MLKHTAIATLLLPALLAGTNAISAQTAPPMITAASPALGRWLPVLFDGFRPWRTGRATRIKFHDRFVFEGKVLDDKYEGGPSYSRLFIYGTAPIRAKVAYDAAHGLAFFGRGCCTFYEQGLAADVPPPPIAIPEYNLAGVHTERGVKLGDSPNAVVAIFGRAPLQSVPGHSDMRFLAYTTAVPFATLQGTTNTCGWFQNFAFRGNRLVYIDFTFGC